MRSTFVVMLALVCFLCSMVQAADLSAPPSSRFSDTIILPIRLLEFTGKVSGDVVHIYWKTNNEIEAVQFEVERSTDGKTFRSVGAMQPNGRSGIHNYHFSDSKAAEEKARFFYYRLRQRGADNKSIYSRVLVLPVTVKTETMCYPNPAHDELGIVLPADRPGSISIQVFSLAGKAVLRQTRSVESGTNSFSVNISQLGAGAYCLLLTGSETFYQQQFLKH